MATTEPNLDEIVWRAPYLAEQIGGPWRIHDNNVHPYFAESPFFDPTSNNALVLTQGRNPGREHTLVTRDAFEAELRKRSGLEFMVASCHMNFGQPDHTHSQGRWVIRKQERRKQAGAEDKITILATYFVLGETIYMAPSIVRIMRGKMLSVMTCFDAFLFTASTLSMYTPSLGHHYIESATKPKEPALPTGSAVPSRAASPGPSQGDVAMLESHETMPGNKTAGSTTSITMDDTQALYESFQLLSRYGHEYMDENPLKGEPGSFGFTSKQAGAVKVRQTAAPSSKTASEASISRSPLPPESKQSTGSKMKIENEVPVKVEKNDDKPLKPKQRKNKAPTSTSSPSLPLSGNGTPLTS